MSALLPSTLGPARLLAMDTSTELMAVAVLRDDVAFVRNEAGGAQASARLLPVTQALLADAGLSLRQIDAVAFGRGPGAFTGLRTSCAVAQGLAFGVGVPVLPIDSLLIVAEDARLQGHPSGEPIDIGVAMDARMDEVYAARYRWANGTWACVLAPGLYTLPALAGLWREQGPAVVCGSALKAFGERLALPGSCRLEVEVDRAAALGRLAAAAWRAGAAVDAAQALPLYLRDKVAQTTAERAAAKAASAAATGVQT